MKGSICSLSVSSEAYVGSCGLRVEWTKSSVTETSGSILIWTNLVCFPWLSYLFILNLKMTIDDTWKKARWGHKRKTWHHFMVISFLFPPDYCVVVSKSLKVGLTPSSELWDIAQMSYFINLQSFTEWHELKLNRSIQTVLALQLFSVDKVTSQPVKPEN